MTSEKILKILLILGILVQTIFSQEFSVSLNNMENPKTELFYSKEFPKAGDTLYLKITIPQGWHINANVVLDDFLIPSSVESFATGIEFYSALWPKPFKQYNEVLNTDLLLLQDTFTISLPVKSIQEGSNPYDVKLKFTYQACSKICLAPKTIEVNFDTILTLPQAGEKKNEKLSSSDNSFVLYFFLALIGGLLLNVMPCVLPVLFLKVFDLMRKAGETQRSMFKWGLATASGIWFSFLAIAIIIFVVRLTGNAIGWGFQFQHPLYTATMALCIMIFALSFFGVFDFWMPGNMFGNWEKRAKKGGFGGAFAHGVLLVLVSTPCSAPFLGTAVGFALSASAFKLFVIFTAIAMGLSLPYLILSIFPQWTKKLPAPGNWMVVLKQFLGFPLLLTAIWLVWIFDKQTGADAFVKFSVFFCVAGFFAWLSGMVANPGKPWWRFCCLWLIFILVYIVSWNLWIKPQEEQHIIEWIPFSEEKLDSLQNERIAVWVNGTADWCITCKMNEKTVFENENIKKLFKEKNVVKMQADYTKPNNEALKFFESYGRGGVPFDLFLTANKKPMLMPEILTVDMVSDALK